MSIRKGLAQPPSAQQPAPSSQTHQVVGRPVTRREAPAVIAPQEPPRRVLERPTLRGEPAVRGLLVDAAGKPLRGLSQATLDAHKAQTEDCTELCTRCGQMRPPAQMRTVVPNAERPNNVVRICAVECVPVAFKDPYQDKDRWQPQVPAVRFDRERGQPYNARQAGVSLKDLVTGDTYHNEKEVDASLRRDADYGAGTRQQNGRVGHAVTGRRK